MSKNLKWKTLETRHFHMKASLMCKILKDQSVPHLRDSFVKLSEINIIDNLRNLETDLGLPRPKKNFLKRSFKYSGAMLWNNIPQRQKPHNHFRNSNVILHLCILMDHAESLC